MSLFNRLFRRNENDDGGETSKFIAEVDGAVEGLQLQTRMHQESWHLGEEERWNIDQQGGELIFTFPTVVARAPAQIIGTLDTQAGTWLWAWANPSIKQPLTKDSLRMRAYGEEHRIRRLTTDSWPAEETDGWRMTALASYLAKSNGAYRGPHGATYIFMTFGEVSLKKR